MLQTITPKQMKNFETEAMERLGINSELLMQKAATCLAQAAKKVIENKQGNLVLYCGCGSNGGDGLAALGILLAKDSGLTATVWTLPGTKNAAFDRVYSALLPLIQSGRIAISENFPKPSLGDILIIDALFGTGLNRNLNETATQAVTSVNAFGSLGIPVISADIPSGINGETGQVMGCAVQADYTVSFHRPKIGLLIRQGIDYSGKVIIGDIGLNLPEINSFSPEGYDVLEKRDLGAFLPKRPQSLHKGSCGKVLLFVGNIGMAGAAALCATAALRTGAGLVSVLCPENILPIVQCLCPCATVIPFEASSDTKKLISSVLPGFDAIGAGCGIGCGAQSASVLNDILCAAADCSAPIVLDADALNLVASGAVRLPGGISCYITPHPAEASRLLEEDTSDVLKDTFLAASQLAEKFHSGVILKGARSVMCAGHSFAVNPFGTPAMAKGGSGDVLCGVLTALVSGNKTGLYHMTDLQLMQCACALHGLAGEEAEKRFGSRGILATDLCSCLGLDDTNFPE